MPQPVPGDPCAVGRDLHQLAPALSCTLVAVWIIEEPVLARNTVAFSTVTVVPVGSVSVQLTCEVWNSPSAFYLPSNERAARNPGTGYALASLSPLLSYPHVRVLLGLPGVNYICAVATITLVHHGVG